MNEKVSVIPTDGLGSVDTKLEVLRQRLGNIFPFSEFLIAEKYNMPEELVITTQDGERFIGWLELERFFKTQFKRTYSLFVTGLQFHDGRSPLYYHGAAHPITRNAMVTAYVNAFQILFVYRDAIDALTNRSAHEFGHLRGLGHCDSVRCYMSMASDFSDDRKTFCKYHRKQLNDLR